MPQRKKSKTLDTNNQSKLRRTSFIVFLLLLAVFSVYVLKGYLGLFLISLVMVVVFEKMYLWFVKKTKREMLASALSTLIVIFLILAPFLFVIVIAIAQGAMLLGDLTNQSSELEKTVNQAIVSLEQMTGKSGVVEEYLNSETFSLSDTVQKLVSSIGKVLASIVIPTLIATTTSFLTFTIFIMVMIFLFPTKKVLFENVVRFLPLEDSVTTKCILRFEAVIKATINGTVMIALAQGILGWAMLALLGFPAPVFFGFVMAVASVVPSGSTLIWVPIGIAMLLTGQYVDAAVWFVWGMLVISSVDNVVRPMVMKEGDSKLPELVTLLSALGGVQVFGFFGFIYGPLILALFLTALQIYKEQFLLIKPSIAKSK